MHTLNPDFPGGPRVTGSLKDTHADHKRSDGEPHHPVPPSDSLGVLLPVVELIPPVQK